MPAPKRKTTKFSFPEKQRRYFARFKKGKRLKSLAGLLEQPLKFRTSDGQKVVILKHGFSNIYRGQKETMPRPFVIAFVNGKKIFFYKSSGEVSMLQGQWFPTQGPSVVQGSHGPYAGMMSKMNGHPGWKNNKPVNPVKISDIGKNRKRPYFPKAISETRKQIEKMESQLEFHSDWGLRHYLLIAKAFEKVPFTGKIKPA